MGSDCQRCRGRGFIVVGRVPSSSGCADSPAYETCAQCQVEETNRLGREVERLKTEAADWKLSFEAANDHVGKLQRVIAGLRAWTNLDVEDHPAMNLSAEWKRGYKHAQDEVDAELDRLEARNGD